MAQFLYSSFHKATITDKLACLSLVPTVMLFSVSFLEHWLLKIKLLSFHCLWFFRH